MEKYGRKKINFITALAGILLLALFAGCGSDSTGNETVPTEQTGSPGTGYVLTGPGSYDSADTAVVVKINTTEQKITFLNLQVNKNYTLTYDGTTVFSDRYGQPLSLGQVNEGDIVDVTFLKSKKTLTTLALSNSSWSNEEVSRYVISAATHSVTIGEDVYKITDDIKIFSDGEEIELMDLSETDVLDFHGIDKTIYSIVVNKGHGYLRLSGDENFIGGWIEIGQTIIHRITDDMLLTVPEGSYQVIISVPGGGGTKSVIINRGEEVTLDIGDLKIEEPKYGQVVFALTPSSATLYIDGEEVDARSPVTLEYGIHQLIAKAEGYDSVTSYLKVAEASAGIEIVLEAEKQDTGDDDKDSDDEEDDKKDDEKKDDTVSSGNTTATGYYQVHIDAPEKVEVYVDGNYIGISPISFKKVEGAHIITLRANGYETRSFTIEVDGEDKDVSYSFADLMPEIN